MAGRAHEAERAVERAVQHAIDGLHGGARRLPRRLVRARAGLGVGIEADGAAGRGRDVREVPWGVDPRQLLGGGLPRRAHVHALLEPFPADPVAQGVEARRALGMAGPGVVLAEDRIVVERDAHVPARSVSAIRGTPGRPR